MHGEIGHVPPAEHEATNSSILQGGHDKQGLCELARVSRAVFAASRQLPVVDTVGRVHHPAADGVAGNERKLDVGVECTEEGSVGAAVRGAADREDGRVTFVLGYLAAVVPLVAVAVAALWPPRWWQVALLVGGPVLTGLAVLEVAGLQHLGWIAIFGIPYVYLVALPLVPWRRAWARVAVPLTVIAVVCLFVGLARFEVAVAFYLAMPFVAAVVGLVLAVVSRRDRRRAAAHPEPAD